MTIYKPYRVDLHQCAEEYKDSRKTGPVANSPAYKQSKTEVTLVLGDEINSTVGNKRAAA